MPAISEENDVVERVLDDERISQDDARALYGLPLQELGALADYRRQAAKADAYGGRGGEIVTYIVDRNVNYTNVCNVYCKFCAFYRTERDDDHYVLSLEQIDEKLDELAAQGGVQVLLQGGHHPKLGIDYYVTMLSHIRENIRRSTFTDSVRRSSTILQTFSACRCVRLSRGLKKRAWARFQVVEVKSSWTACEIASRR